MAQCQPHLVNDGLRAGRTAARRPRPGPVPQPPGTPAGLLRRARGAPSAPAPGGRAPGATSEVKVGRRSGATRGEGPRGHE
eukprot:4232885-Lingulodinium_polyedra.AAC.1